MHGWMSSWRRGQFLTKCICKVKDPKASWNRNSKQEEGRKERGFKRRASVCASQCRTWPCRWQKGSSLKHRDRSPRKPSRARRRAPETAEWEVGGFCFSPQQQQSSLAKTVDQKCSDDALKEIINNTFPSIIHNVWRGGHEAGSVRSDYITNSILLQL